MKRQHNRKWLYRTLAVFVLLIMVAVSLALWKGFISLEWLASFGYKGIFLLSLANAVAPFAGPSQVATFLVAGKLNPLLVGLTGGLGGALGELSSYVFGYSFQASLSEKSEHKLDHFKNWRFVRISREHSFLTLFLLAGIPNPFFDPVSAVAGSLRIPVIKYFIPILLGRTLRHVVIAYAGYYTLTQQLVLFPKR